MSVTWKTKYGLRSVRIEPPPTVEDALFAAEGLTRNVEQQITIAVPAGRYDDELTAFAAAIRGRQMLPWNAAHDIAVHETVLRAAGVEPDK